jgi:hypothetical protein
LFSLAEHLHKTVGELMEQMTPEELQLWVGYLTRQHEVQEEAERRASRRR